MAVRDGAGHLARSVESILNQSYTDLELIIADCAYDHRIHSKRCRMISYIQRCASKNAVVIEAIEQNLTKCNESLHTAYDSTHCSIA